MATESTSAREDTGPASGRDAEPEARGEAAPGESLVNDAVSLLDGVVEYLAAIFRLERYRFEVRVREIVQTVLIFLTGGAVLLLGLVFVSVGISSLLSEWLQASYAGPLIVGGGYVLIGLVAVLVAARKKES